MRAIIFLISFFAVGIGALNAEIKNFSFSGTLATMDDRKYTFDSSVVKGMPIQGFYTFESSAASSNNDPTVGDYRFTDSKCGMVVKIGNYVFRTNPQHVDFLIELVNRSTGDNHLLRSYNNVCSKPVAVDHMAWQLDDSTGGALQNILLPATPPVLSKWQSLFGLTIEGVGNSFFLRAHVTAIAETPAIIPERPQITLAEAIEVKWLSRMGYYYQVQSSEDMKTWTDIGEPVLGDGAEVSRTFVRRPGKNDFYRAEIANFQQ